MAVVNQNVSHTHKQNKKKTKKKQASCLFLQPCMHACVLHSFIQPCQCFSTFFSFVIADVFDQCFSSSSSSTNVITLSRNCLQVFFVSYNIRFQLGPRFSINLYHTEPTNTHDYNHHHLVIFDDLIFYSLKKKLFLSSSSSLYSSSLFIIVFTVFFLVTSQISSRKERKKKQNHESRFKFIQQ